MLEQQKWTLPMRHSSDYPKDPVGRETNPRRSDAEMDNSQPVDAGASPVGRAGRQQINKGLGILRVEQILDKARARLVTIAVNEPLTKAAELLFEPARPMAIVCSPEGSLVGVITRTDIVRQIRHCQGCACTTACSDIMTTTVIYCHATDNLEDVWTTMANKGLHNMPVINQERKPIGLLLASDVLEARLASVAYEEDLLRDYVMCVGFR